MSERARDDDLFEPALRGVNRERLREGQQPWRLNSQLYVAFFGGSLAVAAIAWVNSDRLGIPAARRRLIPLVGLAGLVAAALVIAAATDGSFDGGQRLVIRIAAVLAFGLLYLLQRSADRVYHAFTEGDEDQIYDGLVGPGAAATFTLGIAELAVIAAVAHAL